ncbi:MAG: hypothetical protein AAF234_15390 [Pseudomonadota bacterium]
MPTLLTSAAIFVGGLVLFRMARREWRRVNDTMQAQRSAPRERKGAQRLEKDPDTGAYRPKD